VLLLAGLAAQCQAAEITWKKTVVDKKFHAEGVAVADVNHDGLPDIMVGDYWYEAPAWSPHEIRTPHDYGDGAHTYSDAFLCFTDDYNHDGWADLLVVGFPGKPALWYENPRNQPGHWKEHAVWHSACDETPIYGDLFGDGKRYLVMSTQPEGQMAWFSPDADLDKPWVLHPISPVSTPTAKIPGTEQFSHGLGIGDVNGDGRMDVMIKEGWWEQPAGARTATAPWPWHPANLGPECSNMYAADLNGDGLPDIISASAHQKGIWWHAQTPGKAGSEFQQHVIYDDFSETHAVNYVDINGDGKKDIVTGKRHWAHGPDGDVDPNAPSLLVWIEIVTRPGAAPQFVRHEIDNDSGIGTQFAVADINRDGRPDVIIANKNGVFTFEQVRL
jgi:hypothetical protein